LFNVTLSCISIFFVSDFQFFVHYSDNILLSSILANMKFVLCMCCQALVVKCEANVSEHQQYCSRLTDFKDFMQTLRDKLDVSSDSSGDIRAIEAQLERLQVGHHNLYSYTCISKVLTRY